jgi:hypothetical protein
VRACTEDATYPRRDRFTLQQLYPPKMILSARRNLDAAFLGNFTVPKPLDLLLHYNYGAAVVKRWGHGTMILEKDRERPKPLRAGIS